MLVVVFSKTGGVTLTATAGGTAVQIGTAYEADEALPIIPVRGSAPPFDWGAFLELTDRDLLWLALVLPVLVSGHAYAPHVVSAALLAWVMDHLRRAFPPE